MLVKIALTLLIGTSATIGDVLVTRFEKYHYAKALCDNVTHALIGGFTWSLIYLYRRFAIESRYPFILEIILCTIFSSLIDIDHFIAAKSFKLKDVHTLKSRPFLHCTSLLVTVCFIVLGISLIIQNQSLNTISWIMFAAVLSHHIRDATRRGLWCFPFGSTPPLNYWFYIFSIMLLPYIISYFSLKTRTVMDVEDSEKVQFIV